MKNLTLLIFTTILIALICTPGADGMLAMLPVTIRAVLAPVLKLGCKFVPKFLFPTDEEVASF
uniref:Uncharacterized protein n=1 Tax=Trichobilharzia regenti TaxID=157069 RepID=A0AA85KLR1_TRIRE|nr:unnamed protein product [Trichobilharzia regenti]CAH8850296.1 unnamed protein product [Trichobilharzia regenti]CAH8850298.1 unnamed protein product [Trichobilharzia regenti]CAH8850304.1 unnamed protein product [Trichobilharzia regenti]CAH8850313.1 unnamed protein product [Trichobilharzia regenti]